MSIKLKASVDKENNRVIFAESDDDFIDVLFSFLTMPVGTIIRLTRNLQSPTKVLGCLNNLYASVENVDNERLRTNACKTMLLWPQNGSEIHCKNLKLIVENSEHLRHVYCNSDCLPSKCKLLSQYYGSYCDCGKPMYSGTTMVTIGSKDVVYDSLDRGVFVKGLTRFVISDELQVMPPSTAATFSLISKLGVMDASSIEERTFDLKVDEVLNLLKNSLVSKMPLTETLLKQKVLPELTKETSDQASSFHKHQVGEHASKGNGKICVTLVLSKSKKMVCYAEVGEDFVDLLFSFLTIPIGYIIKETNGAPSKGCINHLYNSIHDLDVEKYFKSNDHKEILLSPKIAPGFGYENQLLRVEEVAHQQYYYVSKNYGVVSISRDKPSGDAVIALSVKDPKSPRKRARNGGGFVMGPAMFTVTDELIVTPISPVSGVSVLNKLKIPFNDIEERIVHVRNEEACRLLVASFISESVLTDTFVREKIKQEY